MNTIYGLVESAMPALLALSALALFIWMGYLAGWECGRREGKEVKSKMKR
jgi:hypothetical protein